MMQNPGARHFQQQWEALVKESVEGEEVEGTDPEAARSELQWRWMDLHL